MDITDASLESRLKGKPAVEKGYDIDTCGIRAPAENTKGGGAAASGGRNLECVCKGKGPLNIIGVG